MKYTCLLILVTALGCRGCTRSQYTLRSEAIKKTNDINNNTAIRTAIDDVEKSFANARLSPKLNPFRLESMPKDSKIQVDEMLVRDGKDFYVVKRVRRYHIGRTSSINAEIKISKKQGEWKRQLLQSGVYDNLFKKCKQIAQMNVPVDYRNYTQSSKKYYHFAKTY